ncbi:MAG: VWA domain-containing protein [Ferruginibacter sp.]
MLQFQHIQYLILLALIPALIGLFIYALYKKRKIVSRLGDKDLVKLLTASHSSAAYLKKFLLILLAFGILIIGLANLRKPIGLQKVSRTGIDIMIALDVSKSMLAQDIKPTRLDRAKQVLSKLVDKLENDRVGIIIFAGKAYLQMPLTADHSSAKMYINSASTESVPTQGTVIGDALRMCAASFNAEEEKYKAIVLISDGEDHDEGAVKAASNMGQDGIVIYTVGMGSVQGSPLVDETTNQLKTDKDGNTVISKLNEDELRAIAERSNGKYQLFQSADDIVHNITSELAQMDERAVTDDSLVNYKSYFGWLLGAALLFLVMEIFISEKKIRKNTNMKMRTGLTTFFILMSFIASAQDEEKIIKEGNDAYKKDEFAKATDSYGKAVQKNPDNAIGQFNYGNALYRSGKKDDAINSYDNSVKLLKKPEEKSNAYYNKGVVLQNDKKIPECIEVYKKALILDPANEDARQNLQKALQQQKQEQQQKQQQDQNKEKKKDQKKEQDKQPKPQQSKLTKQDAAEKLKALMQQEKNLQDKLHKVNAGSVSKPEKDW